MYCIKCGVQLAETEKKCPLCQTVVYHPEIPRENAKSLYPKDRMPKKSSGRAVLGGALIILFMIPLIVTFFSDIFPDGDVDWFGYVAGGIMIAYLIFALPMWFRSPNPVIFVPCDFAACIAYALYINLATGGDWFLTFALPVSLGVTLIVCTLVTLLHYLRKGKLYVIGGSVMALGALVLMTEVLMVGAFGGRFVGWSIYPFIVLTLVGGLLIYLAINRVAREIVERKLFF